MSIMIFQKWFRKWKYNSKWMDETKNKIWCNKMLTHFSTIDVLDCLLAEEKVNVITICQRSNKIGGWKIYKRDCEMRFSNWFWIINMMRTHNTHPREKNFHEMVISVWLGFLRQVPVSKKNYLQFRCLESNWSVRNGSWSLSNARL